MNTPDKNYIQPELPFSEMKSGAPEELKDNPELVQAWNRGTERAARDLNNPSSQQLPMPATKEDLIKSEDTIEKSQVKRAVLGSRALKGALSSPEDPEIPKKTARKRELDRIAEVEARRQLRRSIDNNRGRGSGR